MRLCARMKSKRVSRWNHARERSADLEALIGKDVSDRAQDDEAKGADGGEIRSAGAENPVLGAIAGRLVLKGIEYRHMPLKDDYY